MSYGGVEPALKATRRPGDGKVRRRGLPSRAGASPAALLGTLALCAGGGLFVGLATGGGWFYSRIGGASEAAVAAPRPTIPMPMPVPAAPESSQGMYSVPDLYVEIDQRRQAMRDEIDARHAVLRERLDRRFVDPMPTPFEPSRFQGFAPVAAPFGPTTGPTSFSARPTPREPIIQRPQTVSYSRSMPRSPRLRLEWGDSTRRGWYDPDEARLERMRALTHDPKRFAAEASWFVRRRANLDEDLAVRIEESIADFICQSSGPDAVSVLPRLLNWYGEADLSALAQAFLRQVDADGPDSPIERRQILVGTFQRYRALDDDWNAPPAPEMVRAMQRSHTVSSHVRQTLDSLPSPFSPEMDDLLIEMAFEGSPDSPCAQRQALRRQPSRDRLLDEAIARLESPDEVEREAAYMILAATEPTPERLDPALDAMARAFANESIAPSPIAHAALTRWIDAEHAESFDDFCDCECPIRRVAARTAVGKFAPTAKTLAASTK